MKKLPLLSESELEVLLLYWLWLKLEVFEKKLELKLQWKVIFSSN